MRRYLLAALLCCTPALAQQIPNPVSGPSGATSGNLAVFADPSGLVIADGGLPVRWVNNNTDLKALATKSSPAYRAGFTAKGDGGGGSYLWSAGACSFAGGAGDNGAQVASNTGGCWLRDRTPQVDLRVWGAKANDSAFDSGPAVRNAAYFSETDGTTISVPAGIFYINSLDPAGTGAIVLGKVTYPVPAPGVYPQPTYRTTPNFIGQVWHAQLDMCFQTEPTFILGPGLNRPLIYINNNAISPRLENLCLSGNRTAQSGWAGGPAGKLYTIQIEDQNPALSPGPQNPASALTARNIGIRDGFNGNLYQGTYRSLLFLADVWSLYSGQNTGDTQIMLTAFDSIYYNLQQGYSSGVGVSWPGVNQTFTSGGFFWNTGPGLLVGNATMDLQVTGMRFNDHNCHAMVIDNVAPPADRVQGGRVYTGLVFNDNSKMGNNTCDDIVVLGNNLFHDSFVNTAFNGPLVRPAAITPRYNINAGGGTRVTMTATVIAPGANVSGFTNDYVAVVGDYQVTPTWVPHLRGATSLGGGTETSVAGFPTGNWSRYGKQATAQGSIKLTAFAATGQVVVGPMPHEPAANTYVACSLARIIGWTPPAGYTALSMMMPGGSNYAVLYRDGPGVPSTAVQPSEFGAAPELTFSCSYPIKDGT